MKLPDEPNHQANLSICLKAGYRLPVANKLAAELTKKHREQYRCKLREIIAKRLSNKG